MFPSPLLHWIGEYRRRQCARSVYPAVALIADQAHLAGWSREEVLVAIADAADHQLADLTGGPNAPVSGQRPVSGHAKPQAASPEEPVQKRLAMQRNGTFLLR
ncbi:hypothetical protein [Pararhizobium sp. DWP1-1-3]|uniref:hypothetical protein n=1 Tax=Pararhizobium sp. DWP1-1-3 TaxID=2804652 RepID=UPI003CED8158